MMRKKVSSKVNNKMNPYSNLGRDKFSALLSELEAKKLTIMSQTSDPQEVSAIRFADVSGKLKPVVIRGTGSNNKNLINNEGRSRIREKKTKEELMTGKVNREADDQEQRKGRVANRREDEEGSSSKEEEQKKEESKLKMKLQPKLKEEIQTAAVLPNCLSVGVMGLVLLMVMLLLVLLFDRYWKMYYLLEFQARACQRIDAFK